MPVIGGTGFELEKNSARLEIIAVIEKSLSQWRWRPRDDAADFYGLSGEKTAGECAGRGDDDFAVGGLPIFTPLQPGHPDLCDGMLGLLVVAHNDLYVGRLNQIAAYAHDGGVIAEQGAQVIWRKDGGAAGEICPANEREQRPNQPRPKFFEDEDEDEDEK